MARDNSNIIGEARPHTIKKFELVEAYIETWAQKLLQNSICKGIIFIDCMCNSGVYHDDDGNEVLGTPIRVANVLRDVAGQYPRKQVHMYFNDMNPKKTDLLKSRLPKARNSFSVSVTTKDCTALLKERGPQLNQNNHQDSTYSPII